MYASASASALWEAVRGVWVLAAPLLLCYRLAGEAVVRAVGVFAGALPKVRPKVLPNAIPKVLPKVLPKAILKALPLGSAAQVPKQLALFV